MKKHFKFSVILMSLAATVGLTLVSPVAAQMADSFPLADQSLLSLVVTMPAFTLLAGLFAVSFLSKRTECRRLIFFAYVCIIAGGVLPALLSDIWLILIMRGILGIGMGFLTPLQAIYVASVPPKSRTGLYALCQAVSYMLGTALLFTAGIVAGSGWRNVFLLYGSFIVVMTVVLTGLPKSDTFKRSSIEEKSASETVLDKNGGLTIVRFCVSQFLAMTAQVAMMSSVSFYFEKYDIGGVQDSGSIASLSFIAAAGFTFLLPRLLKRFGKWSASAFLALGAVSLAVFSIPEYMTVCAGYIFTFVFTGLYSTYVSASITKILPIAKVALASALSTSCLFIGQFVSPYVQALLASAFNTDLSGRGIYFLLSFFIAAAALINLPVLQRKYNCI